MRKGSGYVKEFSADNREKNKRNKHHGHENIIQIFCIKTLMKFFMFRNKKRRCKRESECGGEGNKISFFSSLGYEKDGNVYLFPYNDDWLKQQHFFVFRITKKVPETHKIANAKWKEENLGVCGGVMIGGNCGVKAQLGVEFQLEVKNFFTISFKQKTFKRNKN